MHAFFIQLLIYFFVFPIWGQSLNERLEEAQASYQLGEKATDYQERKLAFNKALLLYHNLEQENPQSADLDQALADTYFQLNEYAWAMLYYERALKNDSHHPLLMPHLTQTQEKLDLPKSINQTQKNRFFFSLSQQTNVLFGTIFITFLMLSFSIWFSSYWLRKIAILCTLSLIFLTSNALFFYYSTPLEGILIKSTGFYRAPDWNQPQLKSQPLLAGSKVQILQMTANGNWLKIEDAGLVGYIPTDHLRPI